MTALFMAACSNTIPSDPAPDTLAFTPIASEPSDVYPWPSQTSTTRSNEVRAGASEKPIADLQFNTKCQALIAKSELNATILSAPTLATSIDKGGDSQVVLSYDLVNLRAIENSRNLVDAKCQLDQTIATAKKMTKHSARKLEVSGIRAKVARVDRYRGRFNQMRSELKAAVAAGKLKEKSLARVTKTIDALLERTDTFRARARLSPNFDIDVLPSFSQLETELLRATEALHYAQKNSDIARNVRFLISGGYTTTRSTTPGGPSYTTEGFGKATMSVRLGILDPRWAINQDMKIQVALEQLYEVETGLLWQISDVYAKNRIAMENYHQKKRLLQTKLAKARKSQSEISADNLAGKMLSEIDIIKLRSELVEIDTNITALTKLQTKLKP